MFKQFPIKDVDFFMNSIGDGIFVVDTKGKILKSNQAICDMLGYGQNQEIDGQDALKLLSAIDDKGQVITKHNAALYESIRKGKKVNNAIRQFIKKNSLRMWASITTTPIKNQTNQTQGAIVIIRDITEERQQQEYRTDFAHIASHALRTPLGNMLWAIEYILSEKPGKLNKEQTDYLNESYHTLKAMNTMINDLLSVSRLPDKKMNPHLKKINLNKIIKNTLKNYKSYAQAQNVKFKFENNKKACYIKADEEFLKIIIQNLLENAIRYCNPKTEITFKVKENKKDTIMSCTNKGIGIPNDKQPFIFAKFFRAPNAIKKQGNGTGLGLYITREIVRLNNGSIWFKSTPKKETTFYVKFKNS